MAKGKRRNNGGKRKFPRVAAVVIAVIVAVLVSMISFGGESGREMSISSRNSLISLDAQVALAALAGGTTGNGQEIDYQPEAAPVFRRGGPPVVKISFDNGIYIDSSDPYPDYQIVVQDMEALLQSLTIEQAETAMNTLLTKHFEIWTDIKNWGPQDRMRQDPPILLDNERIESIGNSDYLVATVCYPAIHIFSLVPLEYTLRINGLDAGPVTGEWW